MDPKLDLYAKWSEIIACVSGVLVLIGGIIGWILKRRHRARPATNTPRATNTQTVTIQQAQTSSTGLVTAVSGGIVGAGISKGFSSTPAQNTDEIPAITTGPSDHVNTLLPDNGDLSEHLQAALDSGLHVESGIDSEVLEQGVSVVIDLVDGTLQALANISDSDIGSI